MEKNQQHVADSDKMIHEAHREECMCVRMQKNNNLGITFAMIYQCPHKRLQPTTELQTDYIRHRDGPASHLLYVICDKHTRSVFMLVCVREREPMSILSATFKGIKHPTVSYQRPLAFISTSCPGTPVSTLRYANEGGGILLSDHYHALPSAYLHINPSST